MFAPLHYYKWMIKIFGSVHIEQIPWQQTHLGQS